jgi:hypothetical protein
MASEALRGLAALLSELKKRDGSATSGPSISASKTQNITDFECSTCFGLRKDTIGVLLSYDPGAVNWLTVEMSKVLGITYEVWEPPPGLSSGRIGRGYHWGEPPPPSDAMPMRPDRITGGRDDDRGDRGPADYAAPRVTEEQACESQGFTWRDIGSESYCKHSPSAPREEQACKSQGFEWRDIGSESYCKH